MGHLVDQNRNPWGEAQTAGDHASDKMVPTPSVDTARGQRPDSEDGHRE